MHLLLVKQTFVLWAYLIILLWPWPELGLKRYLNKLRFVTIMSLQVLPPPSGSMIHQPSRILLIETSTYVYRCPDHNDTWWFNQIHLIVCISQSSPRAYTVNNDMHWTVHSTVKPEWCANPVNWLPLCFFLVNRKHVVLSNSQHKAVTASKLLLLQSKNTGEVNTGNMWVIERCSSQCDTCNSLQALPY